MDPITEPTRDALEDRFLPWSQVRIICGLSRTTVWRMQKTGDFPSSVQVSPNRVGWRQSDILDWKRARTPRRLPEPRVLPQAPPPAGAPTPADHEPAQRPPEPSARMEPARRSRRPAAPNNQTTFDF